MKLKKEQVAQISSLILDDLKGKRLVVFKADENIVLKRIIDIFLDNLRAEDVLDREVERVIETHSMELSNENINYRKLFRMIKIRIAGERNFVL